jgi:tetratricopeptide (TPR) repeat protein
MQSNVAELPLHDKIWTWFESNKKPAFYGAVGLAAAGLVIWFLVWQKGEKQVAAGEALSNVAAGQIEGITSRSGLAQAYLKVAADFPETSAGARALLMAGGTFFTEGNYSEAQTQFERFMREYPGTPPLRSDALLGIASSLDVQGKTDQAVNAYKDLIARHPNDVVIPQAKFNLAMIYEAQNKPELARDLYEQVERAAPFTSFGNEAGMRLEELITKHPSLAPPPPAPISLPLTNAPVGIPKK